MLKSNLMLIFFMWYMEIHRKKKKNPPNPKEVIRHRGSYTIEMKLNELWKCSEGKEKAVWDGRIRCGKVVKSLGRSTGR